MIRETGRMEGPAACVRTGLFPLAEGGPAGTWPRRIALRVHAEGMHAKKE